MHLDTPQSSGPTPPGAGPWYKELTRYHWFVLLVSALGWLFDCMDQQLFNLARGPAIGELMGPEYVRFYGGLVTCLFMVGWATGGIIFGIMGDRVGRAKTMVLTILVYSLCTGLCSFSIGFWDFALYRFLTGLGVGGEFAVGVALVAEVMPDRARGHALGWLQALSAVGNVTAAFISMGLAPLEAGGMLGEWKPWRWMFIIGALPALLALLIRRKLKEPERWQALRSGQVPGQKLGSLTELFGDRILRRNAIVGLILATSGVVGLWGIGFFSFDLVRSVFNERFTAEIRSPKEEALERDLLKLLLLAPTQADALEGKSEQKPRLQLVTEKVKDTQFLYADNQFIYKAMAALGKQQQSLSAEAISAWLKANEPKADLTKINTILLSGPAPNESSVAPLVSHLQQRTEELEGRLTLWAGVNGLLFNIGAFFGIHFFGWASRALGRRPAFAITFLAALLSTAFTFWNLKQSSDIFWMVPVMGFFQIALFGGYAIYFPELFPTRLRSTGISFCYNVGRYIAAPGPLLLGTMASTLFGSYGLVMSWRYAGVTMCSFFLIGLLALPFAKETKDQPLPE